MQTTGDTVRIPVKDVNDGNVHFFTYRYRGKNINFFVRMDGRGRLHTHFDACYTCYKYRKGYRVEGTDIVCIKCGTKFRLADEAWKDVGGCVPVDLPGVIGEDFIVIKLADLQRGERLF